MTKTHIHFGMILLVLLPLGALASAGGHGGHDGVPVKTVVYQSINVGILFIALFYFLRKAIVNHFADRKASYQKAAEKSLEAKRIAEEKNKDIRARLTEISVSKEQSIERAKAEAVDLRKQLIAEAEVISQRIRQEAKEASKLEVEKAKAHLRETIIKEGVAAARQTLISKVSSDDHQRLQGDFINNIQTVQG